MNNRDMDKAWMEGKVKDWSAEERYVNRSIRIRKHVLKWLGEHTDFAYPDMMNMAEMCANDFKPMPCASITCYRWIQQFTRINAPYRIRSDENDWYAIRRARDVLEP